MRVTLLSDTFSRGFGFPEAMPVNLLVESTPLREDRPTTPYAGLREAHFGRPGLSAWRRAGDGPVRGLFRAPAALGGHRLAVSGRTLFDLDTGAAIGAIDGDGPVRWAVSERQGVVVADGAAWLYDNEGLRRIINPALPPVSDAIWLRGRFFYLTAGTGRFRWSEIDDAAQVGGLNFATAESAPDRNMAMAVLNDQAVILGERTTEFWSTTADASAPLQPNAGSGFQRGCLSRDSVAFADNSLFWVAEDRVVYRVGNAPIRVSSSSIEDRLRRCRNPETVSAWSATFDGHAVYVLNIPGEGSWAYDISRVGVQAGAYGDSAQRGEWQAWSSWGQDGFRGRCALTEPEGVLIGDAQSGVIWRMAAGQFTDGGDPLVRQAAAFIPVEEGSPRCSALVLHGLTGQGASSGAGDDPVVEMRFSDDQGRSFSAWRPSRLGRQGAYGARALWTRLGSMRAPGRLVQIRCSDPVEVAFSHLELNPQRPGQ